MIRRLLIQALIRKILDPRTRAALAQAMDYYADADISDEDKRKAAISLVRQQGAQAATWALNLGLELLVAKLK